MATSAVDDTQPCVTKRDRSADMEALAVWPAVSDRADHLLNDLTLRRLPVAIE
jgi:hypothetical protein